VTDTPIKEQVLHLWRAGFDTDEIAKLLKVAESWVYYVLNHRNDGKVAA
jgi:DNA-binding NarL/FixJ family response regulator